MGKLSKQLEAWVIGLINNFKKDEFISARIKLTFFYSSAVALILAAASFLIYTVLISNLVDTLHEDMIHPALANKILSKAGYIIQSRLLVIDLVILAVVVIFGFFLTAKTLGPIEKNIKKQKKFITDASHELRTPVAVAISGLEVALRNKDLSPEKTRSVLLSTLEEMKEFSSLTNTLLDISKQDNTEISSFREINIGNLVKEVVGKLHDIASAKNISFQTNLTDRSMVKGDALDLKRVLYNVLVNAITYSNAGSVVAVSERVENNSYVLSIKDQGVGMDKDILEKIFEPFFRGDASRSTPGAGLGLTLSKKVIQQHGGRILVKSKPKLGTEVIISIPLI